MIMVVFYLVRSKDLSQNPQNHRQTIKRNSDENLLQFKILKAVVVVLN
jgi:hypothetical protein